MKTVTLNVCSLDDAKRNLATAFRGKTVGEHISFASVALLWKVLTLKRLNILNAMTGQGQMTVRQIAKLVERDVKAVHGDLKILQSAGVINRAENGGLIFPYDAVHVDFMMGNAA